MKNKINNIKNKINKAHSKVVLTELCDVLLEICDRIDKINKVHPTEVEMPQRLIDALKIGDLKDPIKVEELEQIIKEHDGSKNYFKES
jgi:Tfp pilus assembly protein PilO